jgi:hypothetical protein
VTGNIDNENGGARKERRHHASRRHGCDWVARGVDEEDRDGSLIDGAIFEVVNILAWGRNHFPEAQAEGAV